MRHIGNTGMTQLIVISIRGNLIRVDDQEGNLVKRQDIVCCMFDKPSYALKWAIPFIVGTWVSARRGGVGGLGLLIPKKDV